MSRFFGLFFYEVVFRAFFWVRKMTSFLLFFSLFDVKKSLQTVFLAISWKSTNSLTKHVKAYNPPQMASNLVLRPQTGFPGPNPGPDPDLARSRVQVLCPSRRSPTSDSIIRRELATHLPIYAVPLLRCKSLMMALNLTSQITESTSDSTSVHMPIHPEPDGCQLADNLFGSGLNKPMRTCYQPARAG